MNLSFLQSAAFLNQEKMEILEEIIKDWTKENQFVSDKVVLDIH